MDEDVAHVEEIREIAGVEVAIKTLEGFRDVVPPSVWVLGDSCNVKEGFNIALKILKRLKRSMDLANVR